MYINIIYIYTWQIVRPKTRLRIPFAVLPFLPNAGLGQKLPFGKDFFIFIGVLKNKKQADF